MARSYEHGSKPSEDLTRGENNNFSKVYTGVYIQAYVSIATNIKMNYFSREKSNLSGH
jgi:hypothetical protein